MDTTKILEKVFTEGISKSIGKTDIDPIVYLGKPDKTIAYLLPKEKNPSNALIQGEFLRYAAIQEQLSFICIAVKAHAMRPSDMEKLSDLERAELMEHNGEGFLKHPKTIEILQIHCETPKQVEFQSYEIVRGVGNMILNIKKIDEMNSKGRIEDMPVKSPICDLYRGQVTNLMEVETHIQDQFDNKLRELFRL